MQTYRIASVHQIELLTSPLRQDILDSLSASGPSTVAELARALGVPADALYYHLRKLLDAGLVVREESADAAGGAARYALPADRLLLEYDLEPSARAALGRVIAAALRSAARDFSAALESDAAVTEGSGRNLRGGRARGWLSADDLAELNDLLDQIWALFKRSGRDDGRQLCSFTCAFSPIEAMPPRREGS